MEKLNYFTGGFSASGLKNHFDSLNEEKLKYELKNFINQYLNLSEEEQLKYVDHVYYVCSNFEAKIDKTIEKKILETLNKILSKTPQTYSWYEIFYYLSILYNYLFLTKEYEEYSIFFENESCFFKILDLVLEDNLEKSKIIYSDLLSVFVKLFEQNSLPEEKRIYFESKLEQFISFIFENNDFENNDFEHIIFWYFELEQFISIFQNDHLKMINDHFMENPQSENVGEYLDFVSRHFDDIIEESIDIVRKIAKENDSDIIRDQVYVCQ